MRANDIHSIGKYAFHDVFWLVSYQFSTYLFFPGAAPTVKSCGDHDFTGFAHSKDACNELHRIQQNTTESCQVELNYQFSSVNIEVKLNTL